MDEIYHRTCNKMQLELDATVTSRCSQPAGEQRLGDVEIDLALRVDGEKKRWCKYVQGPYYVQNRIHC